MRRFAVSDVHGCAHTLLALLDSLSFSRQDELYLLGDLIDRGPNTKLLLDTVIRLQQEGYAVSAIRGNHEAAMLRAWAQPSQELEWVARYGGGAVLQSFEAKQLRDIPAEYLHWIAELPYYLHPEGYVLVHGGLNFEQANPLSDTKAMLSLRNWYEAIRYDWLGEMYILHGHTPIGKSGIEQMHQSLHSLRVLNLDAGCVYIHQKGRGNLCAFDMDAHTLHFQPCIDFPD